MSEHWAFDKFRTFRNAYISTNSMNLNFNVNTININAYKAVRKGKTVQMKIAI